MDAAGLQREEESQKEYIATEQLKEVVDNEAAPLEGFI